MSGRINLGLERIQALLAGLPQYTRPTIHVAGTNGKGSVTAFLSSILRRASISVGRFNSPHLVDIWDSISINDSSITRTTYEAAKARVIALNDKNAIGASNFELLTATALLVLEEAEVDIVVLEVGMGGRLDATNAIPDDTVLLSIITSIDLDHQAFLGSTVEEIAREKAGIARKDKICLIGNQKSESAQRAAWDTVNLIGGHPVMVRSNTVQARATSEAVVEESPSTSSMAPFTIPHAQPVLIELPHHSRPFPGHISLRGTHQLSNLAIALHACDILTSHPAFVEAYHTLTRLRDLMVSEPSEVMEAIEKTEWPGRLTLLRSQSHPSVQILADGAHNASSSATLAAYVTSLSLPSPRTYILSMSHSPPKTALETFKPLLQSGDHVVVVKFSAVDDMPWVHPANIKEDVRKLVGDQGEVHSIDNKEGKDALNEALDWVATKSNIVVVAGSLYLVADLYRLIRDY